MMSLNVLVKTMSFYQRHGVLKNVHFFGLACIYVNNFTIWCSSHLHRTKYSVHLL